MSEGNEPVSSRTWAKTTSQLLAGNILRNLGLVVVLVMLARFTSTSTVGKYSLCLAITGPIFVFAQMGLRSVYLTMSKNHRFSSYLQVQLIMLAVAIGVSCLAAVLLHPELLITVILVALVKVADSLTELFSGPMQGYQRAGGIVWGNAVSAALGSIATGILLITTRDLNIALLGLAASSLVVVCIFMGVPAWRLARQHEHSEHSQLPFRQDWRFIFRAGLPTGLAGSIVTLVSSMPQFFLARDHGVALVGSFAVLLYCFAIVDIFSGTLTQAWITSARRVITATETGAPRFVAFAARATARWTVVFIGMAVVGVWLASLVLPLIFGRQYTVSLAEAVPLAAAIAFLPLAHFGGTALAVQNFYVHGITVGVASALVCLVLCAVLIPPLGISGALWATGVAYGARGITAFIILYFRKPLTGGSRALDQ